MLCRVVRITQVKEQIFVLSVFKVHYFLSGQYVEELTIQTDESLDSVQRGRREGESNNENRRNREREKETERECVRVCTPACECPGMLCSHQQAFCLLGKRQNF